MKIWQRYLFNHLAKTFFFLLFCLFTIYVLVDLSVHGVRFLSIGKTTFLEIVLFYFRSFAKDLELFSSLTLLLSSLKVLLDLSAHQELVALQMAGLSKKTLLIPFFSFAMALSFVCYANSQWLAPDAQDATDEFRVRHSKKRKKMKKEKVYHIGLDDSSELIYQSFDEGKNELFDVFWIRTECDVWHIKYLKVRGKFPEGRFVDHLERNALGRFEKTESFEDKTLIDLPWNGDVILERFVPFENRPLLTLASQAFSQSSEQQSILSHLSYKIAIPLLPFFILIAIAPIAMQFSRTRPTFLIVAISLFIFIGLMIVLDGMLILGENKVLPGYLAIWGPIGVLFSFIFPKFARM